MTKIDARLHDQYIAERQAAGNPPNFPDFPTWLINHAKQTIGQYIEILNPGGQPFNPNKK